MKSVDILGIPIHAVTETEALEKIAAYIASRKPHQVTTVNGEFVLTAQNNPTFKKVLKGADLSLADTTNITWAARYLGHPLPERIPGADITLALAQLAAKTGWSLYLVGGQGDVAKLAAERLVARYPKLKIAGAEEGITPHSDQATVETLVKRIATAKPDILLVAFGAPKQDLFIAEHKKELGVPVMIGVGGTLDFLSGRIPRAPLFLRRLGFEWLWRLLMEPRRFKRIIDALIIFPYTIITRGSRGR